MSSPVRKLVIAFAITSALLSLNACQRGEQAAKAAEEKKTEAELQIPVEIAAVQRQAISNVFQGTASLEAQAVAEVVSKSAGVVLDIRVEEGQNVRKGDVLARLENDRQRLQLAQANANLRKAQNDMKRQTELFDRKLIGSEVFERSKFDFDTQKASYDIAQLELSYTEIRAPITGTVSQRLVKLGNQINVGQSLFRIDDFDPLEARVAVPEREMNAIRAGQDVQMLVDAMPGKVFIGTVDRVSPVVDPKTGTFDVVAQFADASQSLRSGMFGRINVVTAVHDNALVIPRIALLSEDGKAAVYVVEKGKVVRKAVTVGFSGDGAAEILVGLNEGEQVITLGQNAVREGSAVTVVNAPPVPKTEPAVPGAQENAATVAKNK